MSEFTHAVDLEEAIEFLKCGYKFDTVAESKFWNDLQHFPDQQKLYIKYPEGDIVCLGQF